MFRVTDCYKPGLLEPSHKQANNTTEALSEPAATRLGLTRHRWTHLKKPV